MSPEREIEKLIYRYAELLDLGDLPAVAQLFSRAQFLGPDGEVQGEGAAAIGDIYRAFTRLHDDGTPLTHHVTSNVIVELTGDEATARSYFTVFQATDELALQPIIAGRYHDAFAWDEQGWYFTSRQMLPRLMGDLSEHLGAPLA
jgi:3-phenylpropionate/cinnamic acid dioxygenase small subunit